MKVLIRWTLKKEFFGFHIKGVSITIDQSTIPFVSSYHEHVRFEHESNIRLTKSEKVSRDNKQSLAM